SPAGWVGGSPPEPRHPGGHPAQLLVGPPPLGRAHDPFRVVLPAHVVHHHRHHVLAHLTGHPDDERGYPRWTSPPARRPAVCPGRLTVRNWRWPSCGRPWAIPDRRRNMRSPPTAGAWADGERPFTPTNWPA